MENQYTWIIPNTKCWYYQKKSALNFGDDDEDEDEKQKEDEQSDINGMYVSATITASDPQQQKAQILVQNSKKAVQVNYNQIYQASQHSFPQGVEDMVQMDCLNEAEIISNITLRYQQNLIFTYIGPTLMVINPYKVLEEAFHENRIKEIQKCLKQNPNFTLQNYQPHIYSIAGLAYQNVFKNDKKQAIVISGESGAGKTENAKYAMRFLASLSSDIFANNSNNSDSSSSNNLQENRSSSQNKKSVVIEEKILCCNPILEAFGNAKTVRNDNSSRFGKYSTIVFDTTTWRITGAKIQKYLLEKSRITQLAKDERNYHIFYHLLQGSDASQLKLLGLGQYLNAQKKQVDCSKLAFLNSSGCYTAAQINDKENYNKVKTAFDKMNISQEEQMFVWQILAAVLLIGNLEFDNEEFGIKDAPCKITDEDNFANICQLLQCDMEKLNKSILFKTRVIQSQVIESPIKMEDCVASKNSLAKSLYDHLFEWLVERLNREIGLDSLEGLQNLEENKISQKNQEKQKVLSIGLLDIFGFENFKTNRLEQLCINYTNEHLQQLYITYVFKSELQVLSEDGLDKYIGNITYEDNQNVIDIFDSKQGIFSLMSDHCKIDSNDTKMLQSILAIGKSNKKMKTQKINSNTFTIDHTQSPVIYLIEGFRVKNMDEVNKEIIGTLEISENQIVKDIFLKSPDIMELRSQSISNKNSAQQQQQRFLGAKFKQEMNDLMHELQACEVHFVRCIKPNNLKKELSLDVKFVLLQIRYLGVLDSIYIRKATYPCRKTYQKFFNSYKYCHEDFIKRKVNEKFLQQVCKEIITKIFQNVNEAHVLYGTKRIYLKQELELKLDALKYDRIKKMMKLNSVKIIAVFKGYKVRKAIKQKKESAKKIIEFLSKHFYPLLKSSIQLTKEMALQRPKVIKNPQQQISNNPEQLQQQQQQQQLSESNNNNQKGNANSSNNPDQILDSLYKQTQSFFQPNKKIGSDPVQFVAPIGSTSYFQNIHLYMDEQQAQQVNNENDGIPDFLQDIDQQDISIIKSQNFELKKLLQENTKQAKYQQIAISHQNVEINDLRRQINELKQVVTSQQSEIHQLKEQNLDYIVKINQLDPGYKFVQQQQQISQKQSTDNSLGQFPFLLNNSGIQQQQQQNPYQNLYNMENERQLTQQIHSIVGQKPASSTISQSQYQYQKPQESVMASTSLKQQINLQQTIDQQIQASLSNIKTIQQQQSNLSQNQQQLEQKLYNQQPMLPSLIQQAQQASQIIYQQQQPSPPPTSNTQEGYINSIKNLNQPLDFSQYQQPSIVKPNNNQGNQASLFSSYNNLSRPILYQNQNQNNQTEYNKQLKEKLAQIEQGINKNFQ